MHAYEGISYKLQISGYVYHLHGQLTLETQERSVEITKKFFMPGAKFNCFNFQHYMHTKPQHYMDIKSHQHRFMNEVLT